MLLPRERIPHRRKPRAPVFPEFIGEDLHSAENVATAIESKRREVLGRIRLVLSKLTAPEKEALSAITSKTGIETNDLAAEYALQRGLLDAIAKRAKLNETEYFSDEEQNACLAWTTTGEVLLVGPKDEEKFRTIQIIHAGNRTIIPKPFSFQKGSIVTLKKEALADVQIYEAETTEIKQKSLGMVRKIFVIPEDKYEEFEKQFAVVLRTGIQNSYALKAA